MQRCDPLLVSESGAPLLKVDDLLLLNDGDYFRLGVLAKSDVLESFPPQLAVLLPSPSSDRPELEWISTADLEPLCRIYDSEVMVEAFIAEDWQKVTFVEVEGPTAVVALTEENLVDVPISLIRVQLEPAP
ncbi:MAG: hypothetical protein AAGI88_19245 [Pseudomonadota bacterium]